jgi:VWFA-related protein
MQDVGGATFRVRVNLVQVHVIVRDQHDKTVDNLKREDFLLYDQGKLQAISSFGVETANHRRDTDATATKTPENAEKPGAQEQVAAPDRFVALVFDDTHLTAGDAGPSRMAALKFVGDVAPTDRIAVYTTSGLLKQEFTDDKDALQKAVKGISPRTHANSGMTDCPNVTYYMADLIVNKGDSQALDIVVRDAEECSHKPQAFAQAQAQSAIRQKLEQGDAENQLVYGHLEQILQRLSGMPGDRVLVMVSPGFQLSSKHMDELGIVDLANQANIVINTLDARGLSTTYGDASQATSSSIQTMGYDTSYRLSAQSQAANVLHDFASGTGGTYFGNSNDLAGGMKMLGSAADTSYVLSFSPQNDKMDGSYHSIKVALANKQNYSIQARNGYYAPKKSNNPEESANQEIVEAALSQQEITDMPLELHAQYFKTDKAAMLSVISRLDTNGIHFRKADGRHQDSLTVATVIFDEDGNYVNGGEKIVDLKLLDASYEKMNRFGLTFKSSFEVKPGRYVVRQVARDSEGSQMAARNCTVEIP